MTHSIVTHDNGLNELKSDSTNLGRFHFITTSFELALARSDRQSQHCVGQWDCRGGKGDKKINSENECHKCYKERFPEVLTSVENG